MKLKEIARLIDGEVVGDEEIEIRGVSGISDAKEGDITYLAGTKFLNALKKSSASAVILKEPISGIQIPYVIVKNPQYAFAKLLSHFYVKPHEYSGIHKNAYISDSAIIAQNVTIYPFAYIANEVSIGSGTVIYPYVFIGDKSVIGENCLIYPNVTIRENVKIGSNVIIHAGAVIGSDGFGYVFEEGAHQKIPQVGGVQIEDDVEIGANVTIDRATTGTTIIGKGTKIDNLVQIGHNVQIGRNTILVAQVGIGGSCKIGDGVILAGQVGVSDHTVIESGTMIGAKGGALGHIKHNIYSGILPMPHKEWLKAMAIFAKLPELKKKIEALERKISNIQEGK